MLIKRLIVFNPQLARTKIGQPASPNSLTVWPDSIPLDDLDINNKW
jgi:hypothetical protein